MADCIFCRIVADQAPAYVLAEDDRTVAFLDGCGSFEVRGQAPSVYWPWVVVPG